MDRSWIKIEERRLPQYGKGVEQFLDFAYSSKDPLDEIRCPCKKCNNVSFQKRDDVEADLYQYGIRKDYEVWVNHGEEFPDPDYHGGMDGVYVNDTRGPPHEPFLDTNSMLKDLYAPMNINASTEGSASNDDSPSKWDSKRFMRLMRDADKELYPGCKSFSKLSFVVTLMHIKILSRWSNKSFSMLLEILKKALPDGESLPCSYYEAKKIIQGLGLDYEKIHACVNDCVLFTKKHEKAEECPKCFAPRYKCVDVAVDKKDGKERTKVPQKILRYFPLKPRLQKLFMFKTTAKDMRWHKEKRKDDGVLRHPADAKEWKDFDKTYESFGLEPRNVRLGLASDGFNPFSNMNLCHSTWPVILLPYNLPPWKCLKAPFFILSMLIPGPKSPGNDIDVFLEPLIDELKELWEHGVETYDASSNTTFNLHAAVMWTINDFPAYGNLSGWSTKGYLACPVCNEQTCSHWLPNGRKVCYMGHRRFLPNDHKWRANKTAFDGKKEQRSKPIPLTGEDIIEQLSSVHRITFGKAQKKKRKRDADLNWTKHSIFFELPYWKSLNLCHNLDVMHIEKNVCDNILGTLLDINGKTKDNINARLDLEEMGIRHQLHPKLKGSSYVVPPACYTLSMLEKRRLCAFLASVKYPDAYASSLAKRVNATTCRITGLKTHDCHVILQQLLPISVRGLLDNNVFEALHEISYFFRQLSSRVLKEVDLERLENQIGLTLCKLERIFPPNFFDIMMHLPVHLVREAVLGGPVQYRWMYPIERYLYRLKQYVTNKAHPEGSMAEGYIAEECMTFCSMYMNDIETQFNKVERNYEKCRDTIKNNLSVFSENFRFLGKGVYAYLEDISLKQVHTYVLKNCDEVLPFISEHKELLTQTGCTHVEKEHEDSFTKWLEQRITLAPTEQRQLLHEDLIYLSYGPDKRVTHYDGCIVNGLRFHTKRHDLTKRTQNCGMVVKAEESNGFHEYYGVLVDIIQLDYMANKQVTLFKCDWYDGKSVQKDKFNYITVNIAKPWKTSEPYVLASQAEQVYYVNDIKLGKDWKVVIQAQARSLWDVVENKEDVCIMTTESFQQNESNYQVDMIQHHNDSVEWCRNDISASIVSLTTVTPRKENLHEDDQEEEEEYGEEDEEEANTDDEEDNINESEDDF